ncbi:hypothetical protein QYE76_011504 [Lolium multiflorum]|uniref:Arabidopsis retrotransposon Orf1 C-terminal domain-containing protein n=1 Tax=Lolium multiflorum TaxID=4521 RepID=A0AAD8TXI2_LOLMU|nr:hypothetical protein QYE76_011504 [Lolium multiflorum]
MSFFRKSSSGGADSSSSHHDSGKKAQKGKEVLETNFNKEYNRLSGRKVLHHWELDITYEVVQESATIQNPTIRYFATFLAKSFFGKGDTGAMASPDMSVICNALYHNMVHRMNLGALIIQHFHHQKVANSGKNTWVLSPEEFHALRVAAGRAPTPRGDAAWEQQNDQVGDDDQQWGGQLGWDNFGQDHQYQQYQQLP